MENSKRFQKIPCKPEEILELKPRYQAVRQKALNLLETSLKNRNDLNKQSEEACNKSEPKSINISDILAENTIVLDSPLKQNQKNGISLEKTIENNEGEILFKPSEITGRSTLFKQSDLLKDKSDVTVEDILASSLCDKIRRITLSEKDNFKLSSFNSISTNFSTDSKINESFKPGELMASQLLRDELSWENDYLPIPSAEAIVQAAEKNNSYLCNVENSSKTNQDLSNISEIENYFFKRSNQLESIINPDVSSPPKRSPVKLVDDEKEKPLQEDTFLNMNTNNITSSTKTYTKSPSEEIRYYKEKKSNQNVLTMSTIENVLKKLNFNDMKNSSEVNKFLERRKDSEKENIQHKPYDDTVTFSESMLDDSNGNSSVVSEQISKVLKNSTTGDVRLAKSQPNFSQLFLKEKEKNISKKRSRSANRCLIPESLQSTKSLSSTLLNGSKFKNLLEVDNKIQPPISPIRSKSITPKKRQDKNLQNSPISLNTTTASDRNFLCIDDNEKLLSPMSRISKKKSTSPSILSEPIVQPFAGSLASIKSRCNSQCSTSSEFTHRDGQSLPIKATFKQCCFGAVKLRTIVRKSVGIRNISIKKLSFKVEIEGPGFQIENMENNSIVVLQGQECRSFSISFCPTMLGSAIGKLSFSPPYEGWPIDKVILLQGYGGHASIRVRDFEKGPAGPPYINLGDIQELSQPLIRTFTIYNRGPLAGFAIVSLNSSGLVFSTLCECIEIEPKRAYIPPESTIRFRITFRPRRSDIKKMLSKLCEVMCIANIRIITGDDSTRQRIRNIIKLHENELPELTQSKLSNCWTILNNEIALKDVNNFTESPENALELASGFRDWEGVLTITHNCMDNTKNSSLVFPDLDETILFRTMISANSGSKQKSLAVEDDHRKLSESYSVRPNVLRFDHRTEIIKKATFTIESFFKIEQYFEITSNFKNLFNIHPKEGKIFPGQIVEIEVNLLDCHFTTSENINIIVYFELEKINIPVILKGD
ncbi:uncharacterized protein LOC129610234 [Condylostylus longicornis]|uniref:uncharacterized protein LOC129610234 n=1 Tax=Condylostylus longicornis TaxID=2530218 RepID=UPI00244DC71D|nr:uncharacterized protein LOC129610234 [Condylostylus longicornis]